MKPVKAYAARNGQSTQFLRERTVKGPASCHVKWWVSLALYAKAMRTPWRLDCLEDDSAFVGFGYSLDSGASPNGHVLLGCSHIYNARGEGLQFRFQSEWERPQPPTMRVSAFRAAVWRSQ